jgi:type I restriction enzyme M protein
MKAAGSKGPDSQPRRRVSSPTVSLTAHEDQDKQDSMADEANIKNHAAFIWSVADLLRGDYKASEYGKVILPLTVLRRLDCVLEPTKAAVLARHTKLKGTIDNIEPVLCAVSREQFFNTSPMDFRRLLDDPSQIAGNLRAYIAGFSSAARDIVEKFDFDAQITKLDKANLLYLIISKFAEVDLHPEVVSNLEMGYLYEELIRRFSELSNETAGEHFTPREVIKLMVNLLFIEDGDALTKPGTVRTIFDPACGTGGMLSVAEDYLRQLNPQARLEVFGQELNAESYAVCRSDMMLKGQDASHITLGNSFSEDSHQGRNFDYCLANPPFGVEWKKVEDVVKAEAEKLGYRGRFGAGTPRINDGSFLFLQHMISKMKAPEHGGSRIAVVFNGSPLFTGAAGSGESEIRRWIIENDWLEAVVALPDQLFYNTGISTYFWIVTNRKSEERRGKVQLIDARELFVKMKKSLGEKRKQISEEQIEMITHLYSDFASGERVKIMPNESFGYMRVTVERPLRVKWCLTEAALASLEKSKAWKAWVKAGNTSTAAGTFGPDGDLGDIWQTIFDTAEDLKAALKAKTAGAVPADVAKALVEAARMSDTGGVVLKDKKGNIQPDADLRDNENVPLPTTAVTWAADVAARLATVEYRSAVDEYVEAEVHPYVPDAWVDFEKTKIGYEVPLTRHFYKYVPPRSLELIDAEIKQLEDEIQALLREVAQ